MRNFRRSVPVATLVLPLRHVASMRRSLDNEWVRATGIVALATPMLVACLWLSLWVGSAAPPLAQPVHALAILVPGLAAGWFTRRHPLLVGAAIGLLAAMGSMLAGMGATPASPGGHAIAMALYVAVAALAGRALRFRFRGDQGPGVVDS